MIEQLPQVVKPRQRGFVHYPLLIVRRGQGLFESGELVEVSGIDWRRIKPHLVVGVNVPYLLRQLEDRYDGKDPDWNWKAADKTLEVGQATKQQRTIVDYFGFKTPRENSDRYDTHYHYCLDALSFYSNTYTLTDEQTDTHRGLLEWAMTLRDFCKEQDIAMRSTAAGVAAQFLRDPRFYPKERRKVPKAINARIREELPGNCYLLSVSTKSKRRWSALELDQRNAHHYHAEHTALPDANSLHAFGDFVELKEVCDHGNPRPDFLGLYYLRLERGRHGRTAWSPLDHGRNRRVFDGFVFSNELPYLRDLGWRVLGTVAGWGSRERDTGLSRYARFCQSELEARGAPNWLKPLLLCTYGLLAVKPKVPGAVYKQSTSETAEPFDLFTGGKLLHGLLVSHTKGVKIEPGIANVLHRGMIEAATSTESLSLAKYLTSRGLWVLQVYADSLIIEDDSSRPVPEAALIAPWRIKQRLTDYRPINTQAFTSIEKTRNPGVSRAEVLATSLGTVGQAPYKDRIEALTGRILRPSTQKQMGLPLSRI